MTDMKIRKQLAGLLLFIFVNVSFDQKPKQYTIIGSINDVPNQTLFYLIKSNMMGGADTVSTIVSTNGKFSFSGTLEKEGELYFIKLDTTKIKLSAERQP